MRKSLRFSIWVIVFILLFVLALLVIDAIFFQSSDYGHFKLDTLVNLPNYLVFIATAVSACLLYITFNEQGKANQIAAFENRFFKFIDYH